MVCYRDNLDVLQGELHKLSEQYSIKCLETESLRKRLELQTNMLHDSRKRAQDLIAKCVSQCVCVCIAPLG